MYGSAGQSWKYTLPMTIMQKGMTTVMLQAMVQPMVPSSSRITFTTKSTTFLEALCVSRILPNSESYEGGSAVAHKTIQKMTSYILSAAAHRWGPQLPRKMAAVPVTRPGGRGLCPVCRGRREGGSPGQQSYKHCVTLTVLHLIYYVQPRH